MLSLHLVVVILLSLDFIAPFDAIIDTFNRKRAESLPWFKVLQLQLSTTYTPIGFCVE